MSEPTGDTTPTEALELSDQQPLSAESGAAAAASAPAAAPKKDHTRTILEVVGGIAAAVLIVGAGVTGFAVGHATGADRGHADYGMGRGFDGPDASGQGFGQQGPHGQQGQGFGQQGQMPGMGVDPDGDNWTGANRDGQMMPGQTPPSQTLPAPSQQG